MRNLLGKWLFKGVIFLLLIVTTVVSLLSLIPANQNSQLAAIIDKHKLLETVPSPRVIVVGGSNVALGLDSELLVELVHMPVINNGLSIALGARFMLNDLVPFLRQGDIVVISPEYGHFFNDTLEGGNHTLALLLEVYPQASRSFEIPQYIKLPGIYIEMLQIKLLREFHYLVLPSMANNTIYYRDSYNQYGDMVGHLGKPSSEDIENTPYILDTDELNPDAVKVFNRFFIQAHEKGAAVFLMYPSARQSNCVATQDYLLEFEAYLNENLDIPILNRPIDSCYEDRYIFDTKYHLNTAGRRLFTLNLADLLIQQGILDLKPRP